jgi:hypothetical protein
MIFLPPKQEGIVYAKFPGVRIACHSQMMLLQGVANSHHQKKKKKNTAEA